MDIWPHDMLRRSGGIEHQLHNHDQRRKEQPRDDLTIAEVEVRIRLRCRQGIADHFRLLRAAGLTRLAQVNPRLLADIRKLQRMHSQSVERERIEAVRD